MIDIDNIDIEEPIRLGFADILYQNGNDIIIHELRGHAIMASIHNPLQFKELIEQFHLDQYHLFSVKQKECVDILVQEYHKHFQFACHQAVYTYKEKMNFHLPKHLHIHQLEMKHKEKIYEAYQLMDHAYIDNKIEKQHLWGLFVEKQLAGFIGIHDEGSMGMLEVLPQMRHHGYGALLESFLINEYLKHDWIPFCQVEENNQPSLSLQRKLGLHISHTLTYWLF